MLFLTHGSRHSGHLGENKVRKILQRTLWWPGLHHDVHQWVSACALCQALRPHSVGPGRTGALQAVGLGTVISLDYIGPRDWFGKKVYILAVVDHYSRFMLAEHTDHPNGPFALRFLNHRWRSVF